MGRIKKAVNRIWCYCLGQILVLVGPYDRRYLRGRHFRGDSSGRFAIGWEWVVNDYFACRKLRRNREVPWPVSPLINIVNWQNIDFDPDDLNNFQVSGNYYQADGKIEIGKGTFIAPNVGIITANHSTEDPALRCDAKPVLIGEKCWIGMNAMILPGVTLGPHTVVGAGAVVTKSFPDGNCVIAGNPARIIKQIPHINET